METLAEAIGLEPLDLRGAVLNAFELKAWLLGIAAGHPMVSHFDLS